MIITAIDTNVISALWSNETLSGEVAKALGTAHQKGAVVICGVVYVELMAHPFVDKDYLNNFIAKTGIRVDYELSREVWVDSGERFARYAKRRRVEDPPAQKRLLADFLIGSHAFVCCSRLLTLDKKRYKTDFRELEIVELGL